MCAGRGLAAASRARAGEEGEGARGRAAGQAAGGTGQRQAGGGSSGGAAGLPQRQHGRAGDDPGKFKTEMGFYTLKNHYPKDIIHDLER